MSKITQARRRSKASSCSCSSNQMDSSSVETTGSRPRIEKLKNSQSCQRQDRGTLRITAPVLEEIRRQIGDRRAEHGGILGGSREDGVVRHFYFDGTARRTGGTYSPDHITVNRLFKDEWNPAGINLLGFVHSHPSGFRRPSGGDLVYARNILQVIPELDRLLLPIVITRPDSGKFELLPFNIVRNGDDVRIEEADLRVVIEGAGAPPSNSKTALRVTGALTPGRTEEREALILLAALALGSAAAYAWIRSLERNERQ